MSRNASDVFRDSLPAGTAARAPGGTTATVFVALTDDTALREAIGAAVAGRGSAIVTATAEAFADQLVAHAGGIAILDLACVPTSSPIFIERLRAQFPGLVLVTAGTAREQSALAPLVADGTVCRFAHKPVSGQRLGLFLDAALRRRDALDSEQRDVLLAPLRATRSRTSRAAVAILLLAVAIAIKVDSRGPVLFRQERIGKDGKTFGMYKFRSMVVDAEERLATLTKNNEGSGVLFKMHNDPRVTKCGRWMRKYSLDELPQLWNVLVGDMSLVGPRPPLASEVSAYERHTHRRLLIKPGLTGLWQINGRSDLSWDEAVRLDLYYVENWSIAGDLLILWRTFRAVVQPSGAY